MEFNPVKTLLETAIYREPFISLWLVVTAVIIFGTTYARSKTQLTNFWAWIRRFAVSLFSALGFIAVLGIAYFLLNSSYH